MEGEGHIFDWIGKIDSGLFREKYQDKSERKKMLKEMGLPTYNEVVVNLEEFNSNPEKYFNQVIEQNRPSDNFYFTIFPNAQERGSLSTGKQGFSREQVVKFIREQRINLANHTLIIEPHHEKVFSGTIHADASGEICGEFVSGKEQSVLSRGEMSPEFRIEGKLGDSENLRFHSSGKSEDENVAIQCLFEGSIKKAGEAVKRKFGRRMPSDFDLDLELFYISPGEGQELQPIFFDILDHSAAKKDIANRSRFNAADYRNRTSE